MPAPKMRESELARPRSRKGTAHSEPVTRAEAKPPLTIEPDPEWHPTVALIWEAGLSSGQADFYESSDLAVLHLTCTGIDHWLSQGGRRSPELLRVLMQNLSGLMFTESDRRKARIELQRVDEDDDDVVASVSALFDS